MLKKVIKSHEISLFDCLKNFFFYFLISSGLSVTSFGHFRSVIRSLKLGKLLKVMKFMNLWKCMNPDYLQRCLEGLSLNEGHMKVTLTLFDLEG